MFASSIGKVRAMVAQGEFLRDPRRLRIDGWWVAVIALLTATATSPWWLRHI